MVSAARCNAKYSFKTIRLNTFVSHLVKGVNDVRQTEIHTQVPEPTAFKVEMAMES